MEKFIPLGFDLAAVLVILVAISRWARLGFATGIARFAGRLAALFGAAWLSKAGAQIIYNGFLKTEVTAFVNRSVQGGGLDTVLEQLQMSIAELPKIQGNILSLGLDLDKISEILSGSIESIAVGLEQTVIGPAVRGFVAAALFVVLFAVFGAIARMLTSAVHFVFRSPILQPIDRFLGGLMGILQAALNLFLVCVGLRLLFYFTGGMEYCNQEIIQSTVILSRIYAFDPLSLFAGLIH